MRRRSLFLGGVTNAAELSSSCECAFCFLLLFPHARASASSDHDCDVYDSIIVVVIMRHQARKE